MYFLTPIRSLSELEFVQEGSGTHFFSLSPISQAEAREALIRKELLALLRLEENDSAEVISALELKVKKLTRTLKFFCREEMKREPREQQVFRPSLGLEERPSNFQQLLSKRSKQLLRKQGPQA